jgi:hypothetical protein
MSRTALRHLSSQWKTSEVLASLGPSPQLSVYKTVVALVEWTLLKTLGKRYVVRWIIHATDLATLYFTMFTITVIATAPRPRNCWHERIRHIQVANFDNAH